MRSLFCSVQLILFLCCLTKGEDGRDKNSGHCISSERKEYLFENWNFSKECKMDPNGVKSKIPTTKVVATNQEDLAPDRVKPRWIYEVVEEAMRQFAPTSDHRPLCNLQGGLYIAHLANLTLWAVQMFDSWGFNHRGILSGDNFGLGNYDQCMAIDVPQLNIKGKYCLVKIEYLNKSPKSIKHYSKEPGPLDPVWSKLERGGDPNLKWLNRVYWAMCLPAECDHEDLQTSLTAVLQPAFRHHPLTPQLTVEPGYCQIASQYRQPFNSQQRSLLLFLGTLLVLVLGSTLVHSYQHKEAAETDKNCCFFQKLSLQYNMKRLLETRRSDLNFISVLKCALVMLFILFHRTFDEYRRPTQNIIDVEKQHNKSVAIVYNGTVSVNSFTFLSAFITFTLLQRDLKRGRGVNILRDILHRWGRMVTTYATCILIWIYLVPVLFQDPLQNISYSFESCKRNFWSHLSFLNNYVAEGQECFITSWYLAVDMQLHVLGTVLGLVMWKSKRVFSWILSILIPASAVIPGVLAFKYGYPAGIRTTMNTIRDYLNTEDYLQGYRVTHIRLTPYLVGIVAALLFEKAKQNKWHLTQVQSKTAFYLLVLVIYYTIVSNTWFVDEAGVVGHALYVGLHRVVWSLVAMAIVFIQGTTGFGVCSWLYTLTEGLLLRLDKLALCALIVHNPIQLMYFRPVSAYFASSNLLWFFMGDLVLSYTAALILYLIVQAPLVNLQEAIETKLTSRRASSR